MQAHVDMTLDGKAI